MPIGLRVAEIDLDVGREREAFVVGHLLAAIPGQRLVEILRQFVRMLDQRIHDGLAILAANLDEHDVARLPLDKGAPCPGKDRV